MQNSNSGSREEIIQSAQERIEGISFMKNFIMTMCRRQKGPVLNFRQEYDSFPLYAGIYSFLCTATNRRVLSVVLNPSALPSKTGSYTSFNGVIASYRSI